MEQTNFSEIALSEVAFLLRPLKYLNTSENVISLLKKLGYSIPDADLPEAFTSVISKADALIQVVQTLLKAETNTAKAAALIDLITAVKNAIDELSKLEAAIKEVPDLATDFISKAPLNELPVRLLDYLLFIDLYRGHPKVFGILYLLGILDEKVLEEDPEKYQPACTIKVIHWDQIPRYFSEPNVVISEFYDWNTDFNSDKFLTRLELFLKAAGVAGGLYKQSENVKSALGNTTVDLTEIRLPLFSNGIYPSTYTQFGLNITPAEALSGKNKGIAVIPYLLGTTSFEFDLGENWEAVFSSSLALDAGVGMLIRPPFAMEVIENIISAPLNAGSLDLKLTLQQKADETNEIPELFLFGNSDSSYLSLKNISFSTFGKSSSSGQDFGAELEIQTINLLISVGEGDGFIQKILPAEGINASFGMAMGFSLLNGFYFKGSSGIEVLLPVHIELGPVELENILVSIKPEDDTIPVEVSATLTAELGPLVAMVENVGLKFDFSFPENKDGNLGPVNSEISFKPPTGIGLSIDAQGFKGGGFLFFDQDKGEYSGGLELEFQGTIALKAIGILNTIMPDGSSGFSLLLIITAEFTPIQLSFGFTLNGVGGLIGINRTCEVEVLQAGVKDGTLNSILFPEDIVANAVQIVTDVKRVFPVYEGQYVFGPMAKIGWGTPTLVTIDLGLVIEIPDPVRIAILGVLKMLLPDENFKLLSLQVNFLGVIDFEKGSISFDASLYESKLLTFTLTGDMALRLNWGEDPVFVMSVGGFHPSYDPPANLGLGEMERLSINLFPGNNPKLRIETYFALTSNTAQFGANGQLYISESGFLVEGYIGFDVLFQFSPFYFIAQISASLAVSYHDEELLSIALSLSLDGPTPWHATGSASFKVLLVKVKVRVNVSFGDEKNTTLEPIEVMPLLTDALSNKGNWIAEMPEESNLQVTLRNIDTGTDDIIAHPFGILSVSQKVVPLGLQISKYGNQSVSGENEFTITDIKIGSDANIDFEDTKEEFAPAQYFNLSDAEKLSSKDFEKYDSGVSISGSGKAKSDYVASLEVEYELKYLHKTNAFTLLKLALNVFLGLIKNGVATRSKLSVTVKKPSVLGTAKVSMNPEQFAIANVSDLKLTDETYVFNSEREAIVKMEELISTNKSLAKQIQVVPSYEVAA